MRGQGLLLTVVSAVVVAAVVTGFLVLGSPEEARKGELDRKRVEDLRNLETAVTSDWAPGRFGTLPTSLDDIRTTKSGLEDPVTHERYGYHVVDSTHFELCATFDTAVKESELEDWEREWAHPAGPHCFRFAVPASGVPHAVRKD